MKKKIFTLLTLLVCMCTGAWAGTETVSWTDMATSSHNANKAGSATNVNLTPASGVISTGLSANGTKEISSTTYYRYTGFPVSEDTDYYFEYSFTVASGYAFTPSKLSIGWAPNGSKSVCFNVYVGTSSSDLVKIGNLVHSSDNTYADDDITDFSALGLKTDFTLVRLVPCGNNKNVILNSVSIQGSLVSEARADVTLSFASASGSMDIATASPSLPITATPNVTAITEHLNYSSSNSAVATVNSTGALTLVGIGTTTITASFAGDGDYKPASDTYTLTVTDATKLGYTEVLNPDDKTLADRLLFGMSHTSVSQTFANYYSGGAIIDDGAAVSTLYLNGEAAENEYTNTKSWRKTQNGFVVEGKEQWVGYDIEVEENYLLNLTHLDARILIADNTYTWYVEILDKNGTQVYKSANQTTTKASTANLSTDIDVTNLTGTVSVKLWVTQGGSSKRFSIEKLILTGATAVDTRPEHTITFAKGAGSGTAPADVTIREGETYFFPTAPLLYKTGNTLTDWYDGTSNHEIGSSVTISDDMDLTPVFAANTIDLGDVATTVDWTFKTGNGAPTVNMTYQSATKTAIYSSQTTIGTTPFDALMTIDVTTDGAKFDNSFNSTYAQVNANTKFTIPAVNGMVVTVSCNQNPSAVTDVTFDGNDADEFSTSPRTLTYTYSGSASTIDIVVVNGGLYPDGISVEYPYYKSRYDAPTITVDDKFNFESKGYKVTITASEGDLEVSTDGSIYTAQTSPYVTYATTTTHYYAKATGASYADSKVADENVTNTFDAGKKYVAWVYTKGYGSASYAFNTDPMVAALQAVYNVVEVNSDANTAPSADLENADLIVCTEAMTGNKNLSNGMKDFAGVTPMIGLKAFNYTKSRWSWGTPANPGSTTTTFKPKSVLYKVLNGVTFESDGTIKLATAASGNVIQTVQFGTTDCTAPDGNVIMGNIGDTDTKAVMYKSNKYFGLGLSCDCWATYTANAIVIVKNAAAMLIADEDLDAEAVTESATITDAGWSTFASSYPLDLSSMIASTGTVKAYYASEATGSTVTLAETTATVPAGEGIMLKGTAGATITIPVAASGTSISGNLLKGQTTTGNVAASGTDGKYHYVFGFNTGDPSIYGFYNLASDTSVPAGKAYLETTAALSAARVAIVFEDEEATGINAVNGEGSTVNGSFYDLQGRKIAQPTKGLYIVNGKKVIIK